MKTSRLFEISNAAQSGDITLAPIFEIVVPTITEAGWFDITSMVSCSTLDSCSNYRATRQIGLKRFLISFVAFSTAMSSDKRGIYTVDPTSLKDSTNPCLGICLVLWENYGLKTVDEVVFSLFKDTLKRLRQTKLDFS